MKLWVGVTDTNWFNNLARLSRESGLDEVNFWQPGGRKDLKYWKEILFEYSLTLLLFILIIMTKILKVFKYYKMSNMMEMMMKKLNLAKIFYLV